MKFIKSVNITSGFMSEIDYSDMKPDVKWVKKLLIGHKSGVVFIKDAPYRGANLEICVIIEVGKRDTN